MQSFIDHAWLVFYVTSLPLGLLLGWWFYSGANLRATVPDAGAERETAESGDEANYLLEQFAEAFRSFHTVTDQLSCDVGLHKAKLESATQSLSEGSAPAVQVVPQMVETNLWLQSELVVAQQTIKQQADELKRVMLLANSDALTHTANRRAFGAELKRHMARWHRYGDKFTLLLLDIDNFKELNDRHGHIAGDAVLRATAKLIRQTLREVDLVARYGGEKFAIILVESDTPSAMEVAERLRKVIADAKISWQRETFSITTSIGVAGLGDLDDAAGMIERADQALYSARRDGRNRIVLASPTKKFAKACDEFDGDSAPASTGSELCTQGA